MSTPSSHASSPDGISSLSPEARVVVYAVGAVAGAVGLYLGAKLLLLVVRAVAFVASLFVISGPGPDGKQTKAKSKGKAKVAATAKSKAKPNPMKSGPPPVPADADTAAPEPTKHTMTLREAKEAAKRMGAKTAKAGKHSHPLFLGTLQGHQDHVTGVAISWDNKTIATSCEDRVLRTFALQDAVKGPKHTSNPRLKKNLAKTPTGVVFGSGSEEILVSFSGLLGHASLAMYHQKSVQGGAEESWELPDCLQKKPCLAGGLSAGLHEASGPGMLQRAQPIIVMAAGGGSTEFRLFSPSAGGRMLCKVDSGQMKNYMTTASLDGRFISVGAFTAETKIWEVKYSREGTFHDLVMVMGLKGHSSQVKCVGFSSDSKRAITASLDGTLGIWNIDVRYHLREDAKRIINEPLVLPKGACYDRLAVASDSCGGVIAASFGNSLHFLSGQTGKLLDKVEDAHTGGVVQMMWTRGAVDTQKGSQAVLATAGQDQNVRLWGCPQG